MWSDFDSQSPPGLLPPLPVTSGPSRTVHLDEACSMLPCVLLLIFRRIDISRFHWYTVSYLACVSPTGRNYRTGDTKRTGSLRPCISCILGSGNRWDDPRHTYICAIPKQRCYESCSPNTVVSLTSSLRGFDRHDSSVSQRVVPKSLRAKASDMMQLWGCGLTLAHSIPVPEHEWQRLKSRGGRAQRHARGRLFRRSTKRSRDNPLGKRSACQ